MSSETSRLDAIADQLRKLTTGQEILALRETLSREDARAVFQKLTPLERGVVSLAIKFRGDPSIRVGRRRHPLPGDSGIVEGLDTL